MSITPRTDQWWNAYRSGAITADQFKEAVQGLEAENAMLRTDLRIVGQSLREARAMIYHIDNTLYPGWTNLSRNDISEGMRIVERRAPEWRVKEPPEET